MNTSDPAKVYTRCRPYVAMQPAMSLDHQPDEDTTLPDEAAAIAERLDDLDDPEQREEFEAVLEEFDEYVAE